jgi:AcrR family transcriptional regulator
MPQAPATKAPSRREARRLLQQDVSRTQLLDAAEEVFGRKGFHETTLKEVAELAEFSVGSVYSFFESKDDLFRQIFLRRGAEFMPGMQAVLDDTGAEPVAQLHALIDFQIGFFRSHPHFGRLYLRYSNATMQSADREIDVAMRELARLFSGLMAAYQALDPAVVSDDPGAGERLALDELHEMVEHAFVVR